MTNERLEMETKAMQSENDRLRARLVALLAELTTDENGIMVTRGSLQRAEDLRFAARLGLVRIISDNGMETVEAILNGFRECCECGSIGREKDMHPQDDDEGWECQSCKEGLDMEAAMLNDEQWSNYYHDVCGGLK